MTRIRIVFVALALVLLGSLALVVGKAFDSAEAERDLRHRALADRIIDELERELTTWLRTEEDRPFAQYRYFFVPEGSPSQIVNLTRSPLSQPPIEPFLISYFQIDPDGTVSSPLWPDNEELATIATGWTPSPETRAVVDLVNEAVSDFWNFETASLQDRPMDEPEVETNPAGRTVTLEQPQKDNSTIPAKKKVPIGSSKRNFGKTKPEPKAPKEEVAMDEPPESFLNRLNRGASSRSERPTKVAPSQAANVYNFLQKENNVLQEAVQARAESAEQYAAEQNAAEQNPAEQRDAAELNVAELSAAEQNLAEQSLAEQSPAEQWDAADPITTDPTTSEMVATTDEIEQRIIGVLDNGFSATIDVRLKPMVGRPATDSHLVLYRSVTIGEETYAQGFIVYVPQLVEWVSGRVLADADLAARARVALATESDRATSKLPLATAASRRLAPPAYSYRHHFAEPFDAIAADIFLDQLPERQEMVNLTSLSLLLVFASTFGLFALYRMVAVVVAYAERRSNFVSAVTHELKTPLTALRMYGEMLRDGMVQDDTKRQQYYETITSETERLTRLVQNVLELSQLEQKNRPMTMEVGDVIPVVQEVLEILGPHAEQQGFTLRLDAETELPPVRYDRDALVQVLFNLVDNALKYARQATDKEVVLSCRSEAGGVLLTVADRGPGVPRQHLKKIFEPFYRTEDELTRTSKGTGIGLALVHGLVERMGGTVSGRSPRDGGFEVAVLLASG